MKYRVEKNLYIDTNEMIAYDGHRNIIHKFSDENELADIRVFGEARKVSFKWLLGTAIHGLYLPDYRDCENNVYYVRSYADAAPKDKRDVLVMQFKKPVYISELRIVPNHTSFAISESGDVVVNWRTGRKLSIYQNDSGYSVFASPGQGCRPGSRNVRLHRAVAYAWLPNPNPEEKYYINHIDGDKQNNCLSNLEWVTCVENTKHARYILGRVNKPRSVRLRDIKTGEIHSFDMLNDAKRFARSIGKSAHSVTASSKVTPIIMNKFEFRDEHDDRDWFFSDGTLILRENESLGKYYYRAEWEDGTVRYYATTTTLRYCFTPGMHIRARNAVELIERLRNIFTDVKFEMKPFFQHGKISVEDTIDGSVLVMDNITQVADFMRSNIKPIRKHLLGNQDKLYRDRFYIKYAHSSLR